MTLSSRQMLVTEDLKQYSLSSYDPLISYSAGDIVKNPAGSLYTCIASAPAGTLLTNLSFFSSVGGASGNGIDPTSTSLNTSGTITGKSTSIGSNSVAAILPPLMGVNIGDIYYVKVGNFTGCTLDATGSETIDNSTTLISLNPYQGITLRKANSTNWEITSDYVTFTSTGIVQSPIITTSAFQVGELAVSPTGDIYKAISITVVGDSLTNASKFQKITQGNQSYNATTDVPVVASILNGTELFVETPGTQTINGISYYLSKGDLIKKSNAGTYSVIRSDDGNSGTVNTGSAIAPNNTYTETQSNNQNITLFDCTLTANAPSKLVKYTIKVAHNNVTVSVAGGGNISYVSSRTFNKGDWVILINNNIEWFVGS